MIKRLKHFIIFFNLLLLSANLNAQDIAPQVWNNLYFGWNASDQFSWRNTASYNVLVSKEYPWNETTLSSTAVYKFHPIFEASGGIYYARTKQTNELNTHEVRPFVGLRVSSKSSERWLISNLSKLEFRWLIYSDDDNNESFRFRNRTHAAVSLTKKSMSDDRNLYLLGYFEAFFNFGDDVRERFFSAFKYKLGFGYRLSSSWRFDLGVIYQDATNNVIIPSQLPTNLITNYIIDWGVAYIINSKRTK